MKTTTTTTTATTTETLYVGDVVWVTDTMAHKGARPHLVITIKGDRVGVAPLTHTQQGQWTTDELGGGTYLAALDRFTLRPNTKWVTFDACDLGRRQLRVETIQAALAEVRRQLAQVRVR